MSSQNCNRCKNPLLRDGTSQPERFFREMDPSYIKIDERSIMDLIIYSFKQSEKLRFWELDNTTTSNWIGFIENDIATLYSIIAKKNAEKERTKYLDNLALFNTSPNSTDFQKLINQSIDLAFELDQWYNQSLQGFSLNADLLSLIQSQVAPNLRILASYDRGAQLALTSPASVPVYPLPYSQLSNIWGDFNTVAADSSIYVGSDDTEKMQAALGSITAIFESMLNAENKIASVTQNHFTSVLNEFSEHQPHFTLLLTFYQLFGYAQNHLNELTQKHIDFYYKDVLLLEEKEAVPDKVHLIFEPAKNITAHLIENGTEFKAGKDNLGKEIIFTTDNDLIINRAKVDSVKNVFIHKNDSGNADYLFASPVADSIDGKGSAPATSGWKLFGEHQKKKDVNNNEINISPLTMPEAEIGFALASPELLMKEGERTVEFTFKLTDTSVDNFLAYFDDLEADAENALLQHIKIFFSGEENWIPAVIASTQQDSGIIINGLDSTITIRTSLIVEQPAVVPYNQSILKDPIITEWPVVKFLISQGSSSLVYQAMQRLKITGYTISSDVKEVVSLVVANDNGTLDPAKPFFPFGASPEIGANFYVGSSEVFSKKLTELSLTIDWLSMPSNDMVNYYKEYKKPNGTKYITSLSNFNAKLKILDNYRWWDLIQETRTIVAQQAQTQVQASLNDNFLVEDDVPPTSNTTFTSFTLGLVFLLFAFLFRYSPSTKINYTELINHLPGEDPRLPKKITIGNNNLQVIPSNVSSVVLDKTFKLLEPWYSREVNLQKEQITEYTNTTKRGFVKFELNSPGFLHDVYPKIQTKQAIALAKYNGSGTEPQLPNEPYTPNIKLLGLDYKSEHTVNYLLPEYQNYEKRIEQLFHIGPFGAAEIFPVISEDIVAENPEVIFSTDNLLSQFVNESLTLENPEANPELALGTLYIGIRDFDPPRSLTLFFRMDEGTENPDAETSPVLWSFLANNQWYHFNAQQIINDTTNGLLNSGIIEFSIPSEITNNNTILTNGLHWLRVQTFNNTESFSNVLMLRAQAVTATFQDRGNDPYRLSREINPFTISKFVKKDFAIKTVEQPFASFGGRIKEQSNEFYARASERLRHKNRAVTPRDYEHLVLEKFTEIYKVKCINHTSKVSENAPGNVSLVTILDPRLRNDKNPFELKVSKSQLETIKRYIENINSVFAILDVRNPNYEKIELKFNVIFRKDFSDETFYINKLSEEIKKFISPWAFGDNKEIIFGGRLEKSVILNFVEEREYVDYVTDFKMFQYNSAGELVGGNITNGTEEAIAQTASSVLITNDTHVINNIIS